MFATQEEINNFIDEIEGMKINSEKDAVNVSRKIVKLYQEAGDFEIDHDRIKKVEAVIEENIESPENIFKSIIYPDRVKVHNDSGQRLALIEQAVLQTGEKKEQFFTWLELENAEERYFNNTCIEFNLPMVNEFEIKDEELRKEYEQWRRDAPQKDIDYINKSTRRLKALTELYDDLLTVPDISNKINVHPQDLYNTMNKLEKEGYVSVIDYHVEKMYKIQLKGLKVLYAVGGV